MRAQTAVLTTCRRRKYGRPTVRNEYEIALDSHHDQRDFDPLNFIGTGRRVAPLRTGEYPAAIRALKHLRETENALLEGDQKMLGR